jgi:hypothetical protein
MIHSIEWCRGHPDGDGELTVEQKTRLFPTITAPYRHEIEISIARVHTYQCEVGQRLSLNWAAVNFSASWSSLLVCHMGTRNCSWANQTAASRPHSAQGFTVQRLLILVSPGDPRHSSSTGPAVASMPSLGKHPVSLSSNGSHPSTAASGPSTIACHRWHRVSKRLKHGG